MRIACFGGGTDSTAVLGGWVERGMVQTCPIDAITFADTGGERPHTYEHIARTSDWCVSHGLPAITIVRKTARTPDDVTLEGNCLRRGMLPSLAYGFRSCSQKYKVQPQEKLMNNMPAAKAIWKAGGKIEKLIGYEFSESKRWMRATVEDEKYRYRFPLVEWEWSRPEAIECIKRMGLPLPGKSSCFFCPASKTKEIDELKKTYPLLFQRAIAMEDKAMANLRSVKGLGRRFSWREYDQERVEQTSMQSCMFCVDDSE